MIKKVEVVKAITEVYGDSYKVPVANMIDEGLIDDRTFRDWAIRREFFKRIKNEKIKDVRDHLEDKYCLSRSRIIQICRK